MPRFRALWSLCGNETSRAAREKGAKREQAGRIPEGVFHAGCASVVSGGVREAARRENGGSQGVVGRTVYAEIEERFPLKRQTEGEAR